MRATVRRLTTFRLKGPDVLLQADQYLVVLSQLTPYAREHRIQLLVAVERLVAAASTDEVVRLLRSMARRLIGADGIAVVLKENGFCHYVEEDAIRPLFKGNKYPLESCISGWTILNRETVCIPDIYQDHRVPHQYYKNTFVRSLVMAPIGSADPIGAIGSYWRTVYEPSPEEIDTIETLARATALALEHVRLVGALSTALAEAELARDELRHRVKNAYSAATALANLSIPPEYARDLSTRFSALARAHELLDNKITQGGAVELRELVNAELAPYTQGNGERVHAGGPHIKLTSKIAIALGLAINELATNALKYGALGVKDGKLTVHWKTEGNHLILEWTEADGPEVRTAALESFGTRLLRRLIEGQLRGSIQRKLENRGISCVIEIPLDTETFRSAADNERLAK